MADYYTDFSVVIDYETLEEHKWLTQTIKSVQHDLEEGKVDRAGHIQELAEPLGLHILDFDMSDWEDDEDEEDTKGRILFTSQSSESPTPVLLGLIIQAFFKRFDKDECWGVCYAHTCSKPRLDGFGGGYVFVTKDNILEMDAFTGLHDEVNSFEKAKEAREHMKYCPTCGHGRRDV